MATTRTQSERGSRAGRSEFETGSRTSGNASRSAAQAMMDGSLLSESKSDRRLVRPATELTHAQIAARAYQIWESRGGDSEANWLEAERVLRAEISR